MMKMFLRHFVGKIIYKDKIIINPILYDTMEIVWRLVLIQRWTPSLQ